MNDEARMSNDETITKSKARNPCDADDSFCNEDTELVVREETEKNRVYDLEERTARVGEAIIDFAKTIPQTPVTNRIITQLVGAGTSVGANYSEADKSVSKKDFLKSIGTCRKEARETKHFLRMVGRAVPEFGHAGFPFVGDLNRDPLEITDWRIRRPAPLRRIGVGGPRLPRYTRPPARSPRREAIAPPSGARPGTPG
jgi:four helix bundle protein